MNIGWIIHIIIGMENYLHSSMSSPKLALCEALVVPVVNKSKQAIKTNCSLPCIIYWETKHLSDEFSSSIFLFFVQGSLQLLFVTVVGELQLQEAQVCPCLCELDPADYTPCTFPFVPQGNE